MYLVDRKQKMKYLIKIVKSNPMLYDKYHEDYMKIRLKDELWEKIAKELNYADGKWYFISLMFYIPKDL